MTNTIIECRNQDALQLEPDLQPGEWTTNIQEKVTLEEGDSIICRNAFIDSRASSSQKIIIQKDQVCNLNIVRYLRNYRGAINTYVAGPPATVNVSESTSQIVPYNATENVYVAQNDNLDYIQCARTTVPNSSFKYLGEVIYRGHDIFYPSGGVNLCARYFNESGVVVNTLVNLPRTFNGLGPFKAPCAITYDASKTGASAPSSNGGQAIRMFFISGFDPIVPSIQDGPIDGIGIIAPGVPNTNGRTSIDSLLGSGNAIPTDNFIVIQSPVKFTIPTANYEPNELCDVVNRQLDAVTPGTIGATNLSGDNQFLAQVGGGQNMASNQFVRITDGTVQNPYGFQVNNTAGFTQFVGTNQVVLSYDDATQKFFWEFIHFPIYDSTNGPSVALLSVLSNFTDGSSPQTAFIANKNSGIMFTKMSSNNADDPTFDSGFFNEILGFDTAITKSDGTPNPNCILAQITHKGASSVFGNYLVNGIPGGIPVFDRVPKDGLETTGEFIGIDSGVDKTSGHDSSYKPLTLTPDNQNAPQFATSDKTIQIEAVDSILASSQKIDFGYFLVEVKAQFQNDFRMPDDRNSSVVAIVNRFYELNSFTSSDQSDSIVYTHKGAPVMLSSFKCRILDSEKNLSANIGNDNTVFLEVVKAIKKPGNKSA